nr:hypothetical protein [Mycolicibacterium agri]
MFLQRISLAQSQKRVIQTRTECHLVAVGERVVGGHDYDQTVRTQRRALQPDRVRRVGDDSELGPPVGDGGDDFVARALLQLDVDVGVGSQKSASAVGSSVWVADVLANTTNGDCSSSE